MFLATLSSRSRRALVALALLVPVLSLATLAGAAVWVRAHGGLAASLTAVARGAATVAGAIDRLPGTMPPAQAAALATPTPAAGWVWLAGGDEGGRDFSFALVEPGKGATTCFDLGERSENFRQLRRSASVATLWFADDGAEYVITDPALVGRARELCAPLRDLGREMGRVGAKQGAVGARMGRYGGRLGALGGRLGGLSAQLATAELSSADRARLEARMEEVRAEMERVRAEMEQASDRGEDRRVLGEQMKELSKRHKEALREARAGLRRLLDEARADGRAQRLEGSGGSI